MTQRQPSTGQNQPTEALPDALLPSNEDWMRANTFVTEMHKELAAGKFLTLTEALANFLAQERAALDKLLAERERPLVEALGQALRYGPVGGEACMSCDDDDGVHQPNCPFGKLKALYEKRLAALAEQAKGQPK